VKGAGRATGKGTYQRKPLAYVSLTGSLITVPGSQKIIRSNPFHGREFLRSLMTKDLQCEMWLLNIDTNFISTSLIEIFVFTFLSSVVQFPSEDIHRFIRAYLTTKYHLKLLCESGVSLLSFLKGVWFLPVVCFVIKRNRC
jgi:hypothetical protein